jgi:hypothetical protein
MEDIGKIVRAHTEALAHSVADIATNSDQIADDLGEAFADFADSLTSEAEKARRRRRRKPSPEDGSDEIPPEPPGAMAAIRATTKQGIVMKNDFMKVAKDIAEVGGAGEVTQHEFVELGKQIFGDAEFRKLIVTDRDIQAAIATLHRRDIKKWAAKAHGVIAQSQINVAEEIAKMRDRGAAPRTWPHVPQKPHVSESIEGAADDVEAMVARELKSAPWLSITAARARVAEAVRAAERVAARAKAKTFVSL